MSYIVPKQEITTTVHALLYSIKRTNMKVCSTDNLNIFRVTRRRAHVMALTITL